MAPPVNVPPTPPGLISPPDESEGVVHVDRLLAVAAALDMTVVPGAATVTVDKLIAQAAALDMTVVPGGATISVDKLVAAAAALDMTVVPGEATVAVDKLVATAAALDMTVVATVDIAMDTLSATAAALDMVVVRSIEDYTSNQDGDWGTAAVWTPAGVPAVGDTATINHAITTNTSRTVGRGSGTAITIGAAGSLEHVAPGAPADITFTIKGNVLNSGLWKAGSSVTPYGTSTDSLTIVGDGNYMWSLVSGGYMELYGNPAFNEDTDLDRTTTSEGITGGVTTSFDITDDLGLRAGGGDVLALASDTNGRSGADVVTTTGYSYPTVTVAAAPSSDHANGTRIMNMSRNITLGSDDDTRQISFSWSTSGAVAQCVLDHCELRYMGAAGLASFVSASTPVYLLASDCAFHQNREVVDFASGNYYPELPEELVKFERCNFALNDDSAFHTANWSDLLFDDCWLIGEQVMREEGFWGKSKFKDCVFDSIHALSWPVLYTDPPHLEYLFDTCTFARIDSTNKALNNIALTTSYVDWRVVFDYCAMDASMDTIIRDQAEMAHTSYVNVLHANQVAGINKLLKHTGTITPDTNATYAGQGGSLSFAPTNANQPLKHIFYVAVQGGIQITAIVYVKKSAAYGSSNRPTLKVRGVGTNETTDTMPDEDETWVGLACQVTPSRNGMLEVELWTQAAAGVALFDAFAVRIT